MRPQTLGQGQGEDRKLGHLYQSRLQATADHSRKHKRLCKSQNSIVLLWCLVLLITLCKYAGVRIDLLVVILICVIDHIEEPQFVDTLGCRDHTKPVSQLLLLEEFLCPSLLM